MEAQQDARCNLTSWSHALGIKNGVQTSARGETDENLRNVGRVATN